MKRVFVYHLKTKSQHTFPSARVASEFIGCIDPDCIPKLFNRDQNRIGDYVVFYKDDTTWMERARGIAYHLADEDVLPIMQIHPKSHRLIAIYSSPEEASLHIDHTPQDIAFYCLTGRQGRYLFRFTDEDSYLIWKLTQSKN